MYQMENMIHDLCTKSIASETFGQIQERKAMHVYPFWDNKMVRNLEQRLLMHLCSLLLVREDTCKIWL